MISRREPHRRDVCMFVCYSVVWSRTYTVQTTHMQIMRSAFLRAQHIRSSGLISLHAAVETTETEPRQQQQTKRHIRTGPPRDRWSQYALRDHRSEDLTMNLCYSFFVVCCEFVCAVYSARMLCYVVVRCAPHIAMSSRPQHQNRGRTNIRYAKPQQHQLNSITGPQAAAHHQHKTPSTPKTQ